MIITYFLFYYFAASGYNFKFKPCFQPSPLTVSETLESKLFDPKILFRALNLCSWSARCFTKAKIKF